LNFHLLLAATSFAGIIPLIWQDAEGASQSSLLGDLLVLTGTLFAVVYVLLSKKHVGTSSPLQLTSAQQLVGLVVTLLCFGLLSTLSPPDEISASRISLPFWLLALASGIMQYALAFLFYLIALQTIPVRQAAFYVALIPVFGVVSAVLILGEQPSFAQWIGVVLVVASSYCANHLKPG